MAPPVTYSQRELAEQRNAQAAAERDARRAAIDRIIVMTGDSSRPYRVLGVIKAEPELLFQGCSTELIREVAFERFNNVDAVIGFIGMGGQSGLFGGLFGTSACEGTAVVFEESGTSR